MTLPKNPMQQKFFNIQGNSAKEVITKAKKLVTEYGDEYSGAFGKVKALKSVVFVINNPTDTQDAYPYWSKKEDEWYQDIFVRDTYSQDSTTVYDETKTNELHQYRYNQRSIWYDSGWGFILAACQVLKNLGINELKINNHNELHDLCKKVFKQMHVINFLTVLMWQGQEQINYYLKNLDFLKHLITLNRTNTLQNIITEIKTCPGSRRAIIPSFAFAKFDGTNSIGGATAFPAYQNYQLLNEFDEEGNPIGLISVHQHRAMDIKGGIQLDISHDRYWGGQAAKMTGLPLKQTIIQANDFWMATEDVTKNQDFVTKTSIQDWLLAVTNGYRTNETDFDEFMNKKLNKKKLDLVMEKFK